MARAPRVFALDEGPFTFDDSEAPVVGVLARGARDVEAVVVDRVAVDGLDATDRVLELVRRLPGAGPDLVLLDGIALAGFNLVDLEKVHEALHRPVYAVARSRPDRTRVESAIRANLPEAEARLAMLPAETPTEVRIGEATVYVQAVGAADDPHGIGAALGPTFADGGLPEPLRLAHLIATAVGRGVSGTKA